MESFVDVTLNVHAHTPLEDYAINADYSRRREGGCIGFSNNLLRPNERSMEPWLIVTSDLNDCAVMDLIPLGNAEYSVYLKRRVDEAAVATGFLGSRSEEIDERNHHSAYCSATSEEISRWSFIWYDDGYLIQ